MSRRNSKQSTSSSGSRSSHHTADPNVFSDDYALEPLDSHGNSSFDADDEPNSSSTTPLVHISTNTTEPISPQPTSANSRRQPSIYKPPGRRDVGSPTPTRTASRTSNAISDMHRASSTSSRFSIPRSLSPYVGATGPSHPYGMYPQITRASSIASASTVRPIERPFIAPGGPEHPYALYPQNTVPEEDDVSLAQAAIPLGFPGMGQQYQSGAQTRRGDIADIVGSDGHIEELPPYSRYADETAPKESSSSIVGLTLPSVMPQEVPMSSQTSQIPNSDQGTELNTASSRNAESDSSDSFKEKLIRKSKQRVCGGLPFWFIFVIIGVLLLGVVVGAIIGGVIGSRKISEANGDAESYQNTSLATATVTSTAFLDGTPLPTSHPVLEVPNGQFNIPTDNLDVSSHGCITDPFLYEAWSCMPPIGIGVTIVGQDRNAALIFDSYPINASFMYGAQPPQLGSQRLTLSPSMDVDSNDLGPSLFAWNYYDKLTILHEDELQANGDYQRDGHQKYAAAGDKPWFCWFNQTVLEVFIYVNQGLNSSATDVPSPTATSSRSSSLSSSSSSSSWSSEPDTTSSAWNPNQSSHFSAAAAMTVSASAPFSGGPPASTSIPTFPPWFQGDKDDNKAKRDWADDNRRHNYTDYPLLIKIEEKRKPDGEVQPYCQQMQILDNLDIVSIGTVDPIQVPEKGYVDDPSRRWRRRAEDYDIGQRCACEWRTG